MPPFILIGLVLVLWMKLKRTRPRAGRARARSAGGPATAHTPGVALAPYADCGDDGIKLMSWDAWMKIAPEIIQTSLNEDVRDPAEIVNNTMRRLFPRKTWPPEQDDPRFLQWKKMVEAVGRTLNVPFNPSLHIVG